MKKYCYTCMEEIRQGNYCMSCMKDNEPDENSYRLKPGTILKDKYLAGNCLGENRYGITYIGRDLTLDIKVAIKEYYPKRCVDRSSDFTQTVTTTAEEHGDFFARGKERFLQGAQSIAKFSDEPGIVNVRGCFEENNTAYIVMGFLDGEILDSHLKKHGHFDVIESFRLFLPVADSLQKLHDAGMIHRDISPDTIMYRTNGTLTLLGFDTVSAFWDEDKERSASLKQGYAPEELFRSDGMTGPWTDVYSLCAVIYRCITDVVPERSLDRLKKPSEFGIDISAPLENVLMHGLEGSRENRFQSMKELADSIRRAIKKSADQRPVRKAVPPEDRDYKTQAADDAAPPRNYYQKGMKGCPRCKAKTRAEDRFCTNCGYDFQGKKRGGNLLLYLILGLAVIMLAITSALLFGGHGADKNTGDENAAEDKAAEDTAAQEPAYSTAQPDLNAESAEAASPAVSMEYIAEVLASSFLDSQYGNTYYPFNAVDSDVSTAWVEGQEGQGAGETLTIRLDRRSLVSGMDIYSGYQKESSLFYKNCRPQTVLISFSDGASETITLRDTLGSQHIVFSSPVETSEVVLTIQSVYPGSTYTDTAVSEIYLF